MTPLPLQVLLLMFAGWINRQQLQVIGYLQAENRLLKARLGNQRLRFTDAERRWLARKAHAIGRRALSDLETLVTPDTLLKWYRRLLAHKWNYTHRRGPGRPCVIQSIATLVARIAVENPSWGYTRIQGALANLGHKVGRGTIARILKDNGVEPAPQRGQRTQWSTFLKAHWECLAATDFFTVEVCTLRGLVTYYVLFFIDISGRAVNVAGITAHPDSRWMTQIARNVTDLNEGFLRGKRYLILDRDTKYCDAFRTILVREDIEVIRLPPRSPNLYGASQFMFSSLAEDLHS
jgi:putative transposase